MNHDHEAGGRVTHAEHIDPQLAKKLCTPDELEIILMRNYTPPISWTMIGQATGRSRGVVRRIWAAANQKVNGGYVPPKPDKAHERMTRINDPDILRGLKGIPVIGTQGIVPGLKQPPARTGK